MANKLVLMKEMNSSLLSTEPGGDNRNVQTKSFGKGFLRETTLKHSQLHIGLILRIERTTICRPQLDQIHSPEPLDSLKQPTKSNLSQDSMVTLILSKNQTVLISESLLELILIKEILIRRKIFL